MNKGDFIKSLIVPPLSYNVYAELDIDDIRKLKNTLINNSRKNQSHVVMALNKANKLIRNKKIKDILYEQY